MDNKKLVEYINKYTAYEYKKTEDKWKEKLIEKINCNFFNKEKNEIDYMLLVNYLINEYNNIDNGYPFRKWIIGICDDILKEKFNNDKNYILKNEVKDNIVKQLNEFTSKSYSFNDTYDYKFGYVTAISDIIKLFN